MYKYFPKQRNYETEVEEYTTVIRLSDEALIPMNVENADYQEVLKWLEEVDENGVSKGNTIEEAD